MTVGKARPGWHGTPTIVGLIPDEVITYARAYAISSLVGWATTAEGADTDVEQGKHAGSTSVHTSTSLGWAASGPGSKYMRNGTLDTSWPDGGR